MQPVTHPEDGQPEVYLDTADPVTTPRELRRVAMATMVGTTIEWYDFFIYANVAAWGTGRSWRPWPPSG